MHVLFITNQVYSLSASNEMLFELLKELGHQVYWAANFSDYRDDLNSLPCTPVQIDFNSNPLKKTNLRAYRQLCKAIDNYGIDAIHCNTPIGSMLGRIAGFRKHIYPVIYTAHGFLFYEGCPLINRTIFFIEEAILAHITDVLVTINEMDYKAAKRLRLRKSGDLEYVHGAGISVNVDATLRCGIREKLNIDDAFVCFSASRLDSNKNFETVIKAFSQIQQPEIHYIIAGEGPIMAQLQDLANELGVDSRVHFIGYRADVPALLNESDIFVLSSVREGLSRSLMEAMAHGLPCVVSQARGNRDLVGNDEGGVICRTNEPSDYKHAIEYLCEHEHDRKVMGARNTNEVKKYSLERVREEYRAIYEKWLS